MDHVGEMASHPVDGGRMKIGGYLDAQVGGRRQSRRTKVVTSPVSPKASVMRTYRANGMVSAGGAGRLESHGLDIPFDGTAGRLEDLAGPADVLCASLCACILKNVERFSHMLPFRYASASIEVTAEREEPPPRIVRIRYRLRVVTDEPAVRVELLHKNIRTFGTITNTLAAACAAQRRHRSHPAPRRCRSAEVRRTAEAGNGAKAVRTHWTPLGNSEERDRMPKVVSKSADEHRDDMSVESVPRAVVRRRVTVASGRSPRE